MLWLFLEQRICYRIYGCFSFDVFTHTWSTIHRHNVTSRATDHAFRLSLCSSILLYSSRVGLAILSSLITSNLLCLSHFIVLPSQTALLTPELVCSTSFGPESPLNPCRVILMSAFDIPATVCTNVLSWFLLRKSKLINSLH